MVIKSGNKTIYSGLLRKMLKDLKIDAKELGVSEKVIRRLLDLDHVSRIDKLESALAFFAKKLQISIRAIPGATTHPSQSAREPANRI